MVQPLTRPKLGQGVHIGPHIAIGRADHGAAPAHHMIGREEHAIALHREGQVIGAMAGGVDGLQAPALALHHLAIGQADHGVESLIATGTCGHMRAEAIGGGAGGRGQAGGAGGMVAMGVGDDDVGDHLAIQRAQHRLQMRRILGPWVEDGDLALADDPGVGAAPGEGAGIVA